MREVFMTYPLTYVDYSSKIYAIPPLKNSGPKISYRSKSYQ